MAISQGNVV